ncbi:MAG: transcriptional regulator [Spirochaetaceae bacterium]|nr:transcriptional regulator [Spirochaetaceae bacterium]
MAADRMVGAPLPQGQLREAIQGLTMPSEPALDRLIHERTRLAIMSTLAVVDTVSFSQLKRLLSASDGNLSVHARKLEDARYVRTTKSFDGRVPHTTYRLTAAGRRALQGYLAYMESLIAAMKGGVR